MQRHAKSLLACVALSLTATTARAQTLDYRGLESYFGEPVTTSATGKPQRVSEVPATMMIITAEQIGRAAAVDIPGILREYTDLDVEEFARGDSEVSVRGYDKVVSSRLLVLINGRQVYLDNRGFTDWLSLPIQLPEIQQIEVVKGPNSALFGFNASGGVVNIVTANPMTDAVNTATLRIGSGGYREASVVATAPLGSAGGVRLSAGGFDASAYQTGTLWEAPDSLTSVRYWNAGPEKRSVNFDGAFSLADNVTGRIEASHSQDARVLFFDDGFSYFDHTVVNAAKAGVTANTRFGEIDATVYTNVADMNDGIGDDMASVLAVANLQTLFKIGPDHAFRLAGEYRYNSMNTFPQKGSQVYYSDYAISGMWDWSISPRWDLSNALRFDHLQLGRGGAQPLDSRQSNSDFSRQSRSTVSANSSIVNKLTDTDTLRLSFGRGIETPSLTTFAFQQPSPPGYGLSTDGVATGNPALKPTTVTNYELAYSHDLPAWRSKLSSQAFYQTNHDMISLGDLLPANLIANQAPTGYINIGSSSALGFELGLNGRSDQGFRWGGNYRFEVIHEHLAVDSTTNNYNADFAGSAPHHLLSAHGGYTVGKWDFDLFGRASSSYSLRQATADRTYPSYVVAGYLSADARIAYQVAPAVSLAASVVNMQRQTTRDSTGQGVSREAFGTLSVKF